VTSPKVAILPYGRALGLRPARLPLASFEWPLGVPEGIGGAVLGDLGRDDHLIVPPRDTLYLRPGFGTRARVSLLFREPRAIHGHHMRLLEWGAYRRFFRVLSGDPALCAAIPNAVEFPMGGTWVPHWREVRCENARDVVRSSPRPSGRSRGTGCGTAWWSGRVHPVRISM